MIKYLSFPIFFGKQQIIFIFQYESLLNHDSTYKL